jgi:hypothetical protein
LPKQKNFDTYVGFKCEKGLDEKIEKAASEEHRNKADMIRYVLWLYVNNKDVIKEAIYEHEVKKKKS